MSGARENPRGESKMAVEEPPTSIAPVVSNHDIPTSLASWRSRRRPIPIEKTAAYTWLRVQEIMESAQDQNATGSVTTTASAQTICPPVEINPQPDSEMVEQPESPELPAIVLTRVDSVSTDSSVSSSAGSVSCDDMPHKPNAQAQVAASPIPSISAHGGKKSSSFSDRMARDGVNGYLG
jgi:hypothetical protein